MQKMAFVFLLITLLSANITLADSSNTINVAIIADRSSGLDNSPLVSLLEVELSQKDGIRLLERTVIDEILREQKLQLIFSAEGVNDRIALGKLLKADWLVLLRRDADSEIQKLDIIIAETTMGLRYSIKTVAWSDDPKEGAHKITESIDSALEKYKKGISEICAVPPFISNDLSHQYDYLQITYARLIEQFLLQFEGVVVVELEEARAITQELLLTSDKTHIERPLPIYILGEYRNNGIGENRRVSMKFSFKRDELEIRTIDNNDLSVKDVGSFLLEQISKLIETVDKNKLVSSKKINEAMLLAQRADDFISISSWKEALSMIEASLLVDSNQPDLHYKAVYVLTRITRNQYSNFIRGTDFNPDFGMDYYKLGLTHLEFLLLSSKSLNNHINFMSDFWASARDFEQNSGFAVEYEDLISDINKEKRAMLFRVIDSKVQSGDLNDSIALFFSYYLFLNYGKIKETTQENYYDRLRAIKMFMDLPKAREWTFRIGRYDITPNQLNDPVYEEFISKVATVPNINVQEGAEDLRQWRDRELEARKSEPIVYNSKYLSIEDSKPEDVSLKLLDLLYYDKSGELQPFNSTIGGWISCKDNIDLIWSVRDIYLMKETAKLKCIFHSNENNFSIFYPCFDGKYVWLPVRGKNPLVLVINPENERIIQFNENDGLPPMTFGANCAVLSSGEICLVSGFEGRGWIAFLKINDSDKKNVQVIHEARKNIIENNMISQDTFNPDIAFYPRFAKTIFDPENPSNNRIIIGRSSNIEGVSSHPLIVNPDNFSVEVLSNKMATHLLDNYLTCYKDALYWAGSNPGWPDPQPNLCRISFENLKQAAVYKKVPEDGFVVFIDGAIHIIGEHWWMAKNYNDKFTQLKVKLPDGYWYYRKFYNSNHYGLLIVTNNKAYQVLFKEIPKNIITP